jgi:hypothetical protein
VLSPGRSIQIFDRHCSRLLAVVEVECSTEARVAIDCALICSHERGRMDQSVFKTLMVVLSVTVMHWRIASHYEFASHRPRSRGDAHPRAGKACALTL